MKKNDFELLDFGSGNRNSVYKVDRIIYLFDEIHNETVCEVIKYIDELEKESKKEFSIVINSPGGSLSDGFALYDRIRSSRCFVNIIGTGFVASMAFIIYLAGDKRIASKYTRFLNHQSSTMIEGKVTDIEIEQREMKIVEKMCNQIIAERTNLDIKHWEKQVKLGNKYLSAEEAQKLNVVHDIIEYVSKDNK